VSKVERLRDDDETLTLSERLDNAIYRFESWEDGEVGVDQQGRHHYICCACGSTRPGHHPGCVIDAVQAALLNSDVSKVPEWCRDLTARWRAASQHHNANVERDDFPEQLKSRQSGIADTLWSCADEIAALLDGAKGGV
jgi:hypothetical protein